MSVLTVRLLQLDRTVEALVNEIDSEVRNKFNLKRLLEEVVVKDMTVGIGDSIKKISQVKLSAVFVILPLIEAEASWP